MKNYFTQLLCIVAMFCFLANLSAQDCSPPNAQIELDANNVRARILNGGDLWWNGSDGRYIVPKVEPGSGLPEVSAIFAGAVWMGGLDASGNLKLAAQQYGTNAGNTDYYNGPLDAEGNTTATDCGNYDRFWEVTADDISMHNADFADNGVIDNPLDAVFGWPGRGNPEFESINNFDLPDVNHTMAPFFDQNGNGIYEPASGDFPEINGATQGVWFVFNDNGGLHNSSGGDPLRMEIHVLAYSYASTNDAINDATFYDYTFIYKGQETIEESYMSLWVDPDLGCYTDDYIGCVPEDDLAFVYNQDATDGETGCSCPGGVNTYCDEIPVVGIKILDGVLASRIHLPNGELGVPGPGTVGDTIVNLGMTNFMYFNGFTGAPGTTDPNTPIETFNYMKSIFQDGTPLTTGGTGYNPGSTDLTNYAFAGNPSEATDWSMCSENLSSGDRRMVISSGPFRLQPGSVNRMTFAVVYEANVAHPCPDISGIRGIGDEVADFWANGQMVNTQTPAFQDQSISLSPNPFSDQTQLTFENANDQIRQVQIYSITGQLVRSYDGLLVNSLTIEKGNLNSGMYIYKALTREDRAFSGKFIIE